MKHTDNEFEQEMFCKCPYVTAQKVLSGKWAILILCYLKNGPLRFNELCKYLKGLTQATLTKQLRRLEEDKLIVRTVFPVVPPHVEYSLSPIGEELTAVLDALSDFGVKYINYMRDQDITIEGICEDAGTEQCRCYAAEENE